MVVVALNDQVQGAIEMQSVLRPEARVMIDALRQRGIEEMAIVSGDHPNPTQKVADALGIDQYFAEVLPEEKAEIVAQLQREGKKVCFVGDGINDAIALKKANASISLRGATTVATDAAQVVLMDGNLSKVGELFDLSAHLNSHLDEALWVALLPVAINFNGIFLWGFSVWDTLVVNAGMGLGSGFLHSLLPFKKESQTQDPKPDVTV